MIGNPPPELLGVAIEAAIAAARMSPCAKSKRGAAVFDPRAVYAPSAVVGAGFNGQPPPWKCEGRCLGRERTHDVSACSMLCVHAEARAVRAALVERSMCSNVEVTIPNEGESFFHGLGFDLVHIKVNEGGEPAPSGGPSCWQCSREIVDVGLAGVWLLQADMLPLQRFGLPPEEIAAGEIRWRRYTAEEFHIETMLACELIAARPPEAR